ncbi:DNA-3-methyladenine glycosylase [Candidatus Woesearchaeota archaeon]|nr:DNA-3-methyladenine glycosylase [Candidatus Woesearchaeota archaeon]
MKSLPVSFFARDSVVVAQELIGKIIEVDGCRVRIVETEAYKRDGASHAFTRTSRSALMYDTYGHVYVYFIYGMYWCLNFTTEKDDAGAVLIRAAEPLVGLEEMRKRRGKSKIVDLCSGPGKLCSALGIDGAFNGTKAGVKIKLLDDGLRNFMVAKGARIGITRDTHLEWRFWMEENGCVSRTK